MKIDNFGSVGISTTAYKPQSAEGQAQAPAPAPVPVPVASVDSQAVKGELVQSKDWKSDRQEESITPEMMDQAIKQANKALGGTNKAIERSVHETTHTVMYVLRDTVTKEVIREFPPKKIQDMIAKMWELAGLFVDEKG